jgi:hypothetical protein
MDMTAGKHDEVLLEKFEAFRGHRVCVGGLEKGALDFDFRIVERCS